jgi:hypothetical protein
MSRVAMQSERCDIHRSTGMATRTSESVSICLGNLSILVIPPRNPNDDDDDNEEEQDEDGESEAEEDEPAVIREPDE